MINGKGVRITEHAVIRLEDRLGLRSKYEFVKVVKQARMCGLPRGRYNGAFREYLDTHFIKQSLSQRYKIYEGAVYLFGGQDGKKLITVVSIPEPFKEMSKHPMPQKKKP